MNKYVTNLTLPNGTNVLIKDSEARTNLSNEVTRAESKETELKNAIDTETKRATKKETELQNLIETINNAQHPIGSIYMSMNSTSPASIFGGTWEQIKDRFILAAGDTYEVGSTGGEAQHALTKEEMPKHRHSSSTYADGYPINTSGTGGYCTWVNGGKPHDNEPTTGENGEVRTSWVGGSQPHNNMPPYLAVYVWKRIA